jgi:hypothetical protein
MGETDVKTGDIVPGLGIYRVVHSAHRLSHKVVILKGEHFPLCSERSQPVIFYFAQAVPFLFPSHLYRFDELPVIEDEATASAA